MKDQNETQNQLLNELMELRRRVAELEPLENERKRTEEKYRTIVRTAMDGFWIVDMQGRFLDVNDAYCRLIGYSRDELLTIRISDVEAVERPEETARRIQKIMEVGGDRFETHHRCKDGRIIDIEVSVNYMEVGGGRMFVFLRDITEHKRAEEAFRSSEESAKKLAQENVVMAEIGQIISSTLNINEVYERFAEEAHKLIPFDRIMINLADLKNNTSTTAYIAGIDVPSRQAGDITSMAGTVTEEVIRTRSRLLIQVDNDNIDEVARRFPSLLPTFQAGLQSLIFVPLISKDQVIGVLSLRATKPNAYTETDLRLTERVGNQIAGAIANAQLFIELQKALTQVKQLSGLLPICASCKKIRDDKGCWNQIESYIRDRSEAEFSHGICPECMKKLYPGFDEEV